MESTITDLALDLGVFALDYEIENAMELGTYEAPANYMCEEQYSLSA